MKTYFKSISRQTGFTMMDVVIGLGIGVFLLGGSIYIYTTTISSFYSLIATNRLSSQMATAMTIMTNDIRRAGFNGQALTQLASGNNTSPFMAADKDIQTPSSSCILFTYDVNQSGTLRALNSADFDEHFGYRLENGAIQARPPTDSAFSCSSGVWDNLTDPSLITITALSFTISPTEITLNTIGNKLVIRVVTISATAQLVQDPSISMTMTQTIRVRNDKFQSS